MEDWWSVRRMDHNVGVAWTVGCPGNKCCFDDFMILDLSRLSRLMKTNRTTAVKLQVIRMTRV